MRWLALLIMTTLLSLSGATAAAGPTSGSTPTGMVNYFGVTGARVYVDGTLTGTIPSASLLTEGEHAFQVELPNGTSFELIKDVRFEGGAPLNLALSPADGDTAPPASAVTQAPPATPGPPATPDSTPPASGASLVNLFGITGSAVSIDGERAGLIPFTIMLANGPHTFTVETPSGHAYERTDTIEGDGSSPMNLPLNPPAD